MNGYGFDSPEYTHVKKRMEVLSQVQCAETEGKDSAEHLPDAGKYEAFISAATSWSFEGYRQHTGCIAYAPLTSEGLSLSYTSFVQMAEAFKQAMQVAPDASLLVQAANMLVHHGVSFCHLHLLPEFNAEVFVGKGGSRLRNNIEAYDFDLVHAEMKSGGNSVDGGLCGVNETGVLLWCGDVEIAKVGWRKQIEARKRIDDLVQKGERVWSEYLYEELTIKAVLVGGMLAAGAKDMVRELIPHTFTGIALRDSLVASELEKTIRDTPFSWQGPEGYCFWRVETIMLQARALAALVDDSEVDVEALRAWLPRPDELIYIAEHESLHAHAHISGAAHPAILCATLYATRLEAWDDAEATVQGVLAIAPLGDGKGFGMQPLVRIEAWRLLARCRGACGKAREACEALEQAASESRAVGYIWMEAESLRDMLQWVEGDSEESSRRVHARIDAVMQLSKRATVLGQKNQSAPFKTADEESSSYVPDIGKFDAFISGAAPVMMESAKSYGFLNYTPLTVETLSQSWIALVECWKWYQRGFLVAPDLARRSFCACHQQLGVTWTRLHKLPEFDLEQTAGKGGSKLRYNIDSYEFDLIHAETKISTLAVDEFLLSGSEVGVLLWYGDLEAAKAGWRKQIEAHKQIHALVQKGERSWSEYLFELVMYSPLTLLSGMLAADEMGLVRELIPHTLTGIALRDSMVALELEKIIRESFFTWESPEGYCFWRAETIMLQARALAAVADVCEVDVEALRAWLPRPDELIYIAEHESLHAHAHISGAAHPAILCATLYATRLEAWDDAEATVQGVLAIAPLGDGKGFGMQPLVRIEAWRLLARCRGACGKAREACEALEQAASESRAVGYIWMEAESLRDMLQWVEGDWEKAFLRIRIAAVKSDFQVHAQTRTT